MTAPFWQAKIWGLLHDPALKALHDRTGRAREGSWQNLDCMEGWISPKAKSLKPAQYSSNWLKQIALSDRIASASDRAAIGRLPFTTAIDYDAEGIEIRHLLSGAKQTLKLGQWHDLLLSLGQERGKRLNEIEDSLIPESIRTCQDARKVYWWLWRCYPVALATAFEAGGRRQEAEGRRQEAGGRKEEERGEKNPVPQQNNPVPPLPRGVRGVTGINETQENNNPVPQENNNPVPPLARGDRGVTGINETNPVPPLARGDRGVTGDSNEPCLPLLPAETRIPDASVWSHSTMTSALAGALAGYHKDRQTYPQKGARKGKDYYQSRPYVSIFSFTPVQELIKASRKMRDFWAGSWLLHYLSAKVSWAIAWKYGPDTLLYPCLYAQPLIDLWLLKEYPEFKQWITTPTERQLLTAGFPNVLVTILPDNGDASTDAKVKNPVKAAMQHAEETLEKEWMNLGRQVLNDLQTKGKERWMPGLNPHTWEDWLKAQWQTYWTALPIGDRASELHQSPRKKADYETWEKKQNDLARPQPELLVKPEANFVKASYEIGVKEDWQNRHQPSYSHKSHKARQPNLNVGSWWGNLFDQTRFALTAVKNARTWMIPTAFGPRSTISGIGPVVHSYWVKEGDTQKDWVTEGDTQNDWKRQVGLFDGIEQLNATEVLKRGLHRILPDILQRSDIKLELYYPDLCSGVAGWLKLHPEAADYYQQACSKISDKFPWTKAGKNPPVKQPWGIPWVSNHHRNWQNPRLLNAGWLIEDFEAKPNKSDEVFTKTEQKQQKQAELQKLRESIGQWFAPGNNPTDWYAIAAGDGDGMSNWLKGQPLKNYSDYIPDALPPKIQQLPENLRHSFLEFLNCKKRMGPATHNALSRALLDFSNQLLPYLTEVRHAGRLIYGGGDDVLAYTNMWEWDDWLWDIRQCFRGDKDPQQQFISEGDYWRWNGGDLPQNIQDRPLFTMGHCATISFGIVLAHHSVPLAIALENLWAAEKSAKDHKSPDDRKKDAVQVRVLYGNGNILTATAKFEAFDLWRSLLSFEQLDSGLFEHAAMVLNQHPIPVKEAIAPWTNAFCDRREVFHGDDQLQRQFQIALSAFMTKLYETTDTKECDMQLQSWLKVAAFVVRQRKIKLVRT